MVLTFGVCFFFPPFVLVWGIRFCYFILPFFPFVSHLTLGTLCHLPPFTDSKGACHTLKGHTCVFFPKSLIIALSGSWFWFDFFSFQWVLTFPINPPVSSFWRLGLAVLENLAIMSPSGSYYATCPAHSRSNGLFLNGYTKFVLPPKCKFTAAYGLTGNSLFRPT